MDLKKQYNGAPILFLILVFIVVMAIVIPSENEEWGEQNKQRTMLNAKKNLRDLCGTNDVCLADVEKNFQQCLDIHVEEHGGKVSDYCVDEPSLYMCVSNLSRAQYEKALGELHSSTLENRNSCSWML